MKKILINILAFIFVCGTMNAQKLNWQERRKAADKIDELIEKYINNCQLTELGKPEYSSQTIEAFGELFVENAKITDKISPQETEDGSTEMRQQTFEEYANNLQALYKDGMLITITKMQADYSQLDELKARVFIERRLKARKEAGGYYREVSDVVLYIDIDSDLQFAKITELTTEPLFIPINQPPTAQGAKYEVKSGESIDINLASLTDDPDGDNAKLKHEISKKPVSGKLTGAGRKWTYTANKVSEDMSEKFTYKVSDEKGAETQATITITIKKKYENDNEGVVRREKNRRGLHLSPIVGIGNNNFDSGSLTLDYGNNRGVTQDAINAVSGSGLNFGLELDYFFHNNVGIGAGIMYTRLGGEFNVQGFEARYQSDMYNGGRNTALDYERIVRAENLTETYTVTNIGVPILLKLRYFFGENKKVGIHAGVGILYNLASSATSDLGSGKVDYEAIYYSADGITYGYDNENAQSQYTNVITLEEYQLYSPADNIDEVALNTLSNDFDADELNIGTGLEIFNVDNNPTFDADITFIARLGLLFYLSDQLSASVSGQFVSGKLNSSSASPYRILDIIDTAEKKGEYHSPLNGGGNYSNVGLTLGLSMRLSRKK